MMPSFCQKKILNDPAALVIAFVFFWAGLFCADSLSAAPVTDDLGRLVALPGEPSRIISLAPGITEILFALGLDERIVGVTSFCDWPHPAKLKTHVGGFTNPSLEKIIALAPDLIIVTADGNRLETVRKLEKIGMTVYVTHPSDTEGIIQSLLRIGEMTGREQTAQKLAAALRHRLEAVSLRVQNKKKPRVFFQIGMDPVISVNGRTLISDVIVQAGGVNMAADQPARYPRYSAEGVMAGAPDVLLFAPMASDKEFKKVKTYWQQFPGIPAVKNHRIHPIDTDLIGRASLRIVDAIEQTARLLHPEMEE
ncbi:MAG: cobalamin-binding protein [Smithellaceae bacterium]